MRFLMNGLPPLLKFRYLAGKTVQRDGHPAVQLGVFYRYLPREGAAVVSSENVRFCVIRITASFGSDGFKIRRARVDAVLKEEGEKPAPSAYDKYPKAIEEVSTSTLELGLETNKTWAPLSIQATYRTELRRIRSILSGAGTGQRVWWTFRRHKGQNALVGDADLFVTVLGLEESRIRAKATMEASLGFGREEIIVALNFAIPPSH
jgi:hypothetical protein